MAPMSKRETHHERFGWGNSILARNVKFWTCSYCGILIKDDTPFEITLINGNPVPFILDSEVCLRLQILKLEAQHIDRPEP